MSNTPSRALFSGTTLMFLTLGLPCVGLADTTIAVLGIEALAGAPESVATALTDALRQRAGATAGFRLAQGRDLVEVKLVFSCTDEAPTCMTQAAQSIGTEKLIFGNVQPVGTEAFLVTLKLLDAKRGLIDSWVSEQMSKAQASGNPLHGQVQKWFSALAGQSLPGTVRLLGGAIGGTVTLDGFQSGTLGADGLTMAGVSSGKHTLVVTKSGFKTFERSFTLASGGQERIQVEMPPVEAALAAGAGTSVAPVGTEGQAMPDVGTTETVDTNQSYRVAAWAVLGIGIAGVGLGTFSSIKIHQLNSTLDPYRRYPCKTGASAGILACDSKGEVKGEITDPELIKWRQDQYELGNTYQKVQWLAYGIGGTALLTSAYLFYRGYRQPTELAKSNGASFAFVPVVGPGSAGGFASVSY